MVFCPRGKKMTKSLSWLRFFAQGEKRATLLHTSGSKVAHYTGCLIKNASTHNFFICYPISMNKKYQRYGFSCATKHEKWTHVAT
jgi:hypothetical protein